MPLLVRYIGNIFAIILVGGDSGSTLEELNEFKADINNVGILKWNIDEPSLQVNYLDLALQLVDGYIHTKTYQKPINLYQYITPNSAHPPWVIQGITTSMYL